MRLRTTMKAAFKPISDDQPPAKKPRTAEDREQTHQHKSRPLPLELNCEIFKCLALPIQRKFIWRLGRGIHNMFAPKIRAILKKLANPNENHWNLSNTAVAISPNGLNVSNTNGWQAIFATKPFPISAALCRNDGFRGTIFYYYELTRITYKWGFKFGYSDGNNHHSFFGFTPNCYCAPHNYGYSWCDVCELNFHQHFFKWPIGAKMNGVRDVYGCGLLLNPANKLFIFFTLNGILMDQQILINPSVDFLYPSIYMFDVSLEANFGDDPARPFIFDIEGTCPGLVVENIQH